MIPSSAPHVQYEFWKKELASAIKDPAELFDYLELPQQYLTEAIQVSHLFPLRVTRGFMARMQKGDINDPLLLQVLPLQLETLDRPGFVTDPVGDTAAASVPGVIHKYRGRVLLITTGACGIHCRYCFRRHFPYAEHSPNSQNWRSALHYIAQDSSITEVILSGGDPLSLSDDKLSQLLFALADIAHLKTVRIHSRMPIVLPRRIVPSLLSALTSTALKVVFVVHTNHANEIDQEVAASLAALHCAGIVLFNQTVLLKNINDNARDLALLSEKLFQAKVIPYYLHQLDPVAGAAHFFVDHGRIKTIYTELQQQLPGYLVPKLVKEIPGATHKIAVL